MRRSIVAVCPGVVRISFIFEHKERSQIQDHAFAELGRLGEARNRISLLEFLERLATLRRQATIMINLRTSRTLCRNCATSSDVMMK